MEKIIKMMIICCMMFQIVSAQNKPTQKNVDQKVIDLIGKMTLEEKVGQLSQYVGRFMLTGPLSARLQDSLLINNQVGSVLNIGGTKLLRDLQDKTLKHSRLKIPLLFGYDVVHGYRTIFPVPLAESCSWDLKLMEGTAAIAAQEASSAGVNWTFAPMVDIGRDPRWGRVVEGAGEDTYLGSSIAYARVKGFQRNFGDVTSVMACAKHFAAYGAPQSGKDYGPVDISNRTLYDVYLPPFKSAVDAGVQTFMSSFNEINGIPSTSNSFLLTDLLRTQWGFKGFVVSDWNAIKQLVVQGTAANDSEAAMSALNAGTDMDMTDGLYNKHLVQLIKEGKVSMQTIDLSVARVLKAKFMLGLFDDPYRFLNDDREKRTLLKPEFRTAARDAAKKSIVLLENRNDLLPYNFSKKKVAIIGPLADNNTDILGSWKAKGDSTEAVSLLKGFKNRYGNKIEINYSQGCEVLGKDTSGFRDAVNAARKSDVVIVAVGEKANMTGEAASRASLELPGIQNDLVEALINTGKPVIVILMNGRPLSINMISEKANAVLETWFLGTEAGNAIVDVLSGDYNPSGKLTITFPREVGQVPIYYSSKNSGRPGDMLEGSTNRFIDLPTSPLYPFGYGKSYSEFKYAKPELEDSKFSFYKPLKVKVKVTNVSKYDGEEVVQLYVNDVTSSITRPVKELKGFKKVFLVAGETKTIEFELEAKDLGFHNSEMKYVTELGEFKIMTGSNSEEVQSVSAFLCE